MDDKMMVKNILRTYDSASEAQWIEGANWYLDAHNWCADHAKQYGLSLDQVIGILAVTSPRETWEQNQRIARNIMAYGDAATLRKAVEKANKIRAGATLDQVLRSKAPKVRSFAACIKDPFNEESVVIDRHAIDIATGAFGDEITRKIIERAGAYDRFAGVYKKTAVELDLRPLEVQAITWVAWRKQKVTR